MHILLSNDDGYLAAGLRQLAKALAEQHTVTVVAPGHLLAKGSARIHELAPFVDLSDYAGDADSVSGMMLANVELPPRRGDTAEFDGVVLRIEEVQGMTVESVSVLYSPDKPDRSAASDH